VEEQATSSSVRIQPPLAPGEKRQKSHNIYMNLGQQISAC